MFYEPGQHKASGFRHDPPRPSRPPAHPPISTIGKDGVGNLAPIVFNAVASTRRW